MNKLTKSLQWVDKNILKVMIFIYIFLIPLYPKLPIRSVDYTYVAIRLEDLYIGLLVLVFIIQVLRKKVHFYTKFLIPFILFWLAVLASYVWGKFVQNTILDIYLGFLHVIRRFEYMIIFFIAASTLDSKKEFYNYLKAIFTVMAIVTIYGIGQKFFGWAAVQTMNAEYAKGYFLFLEAAARVSSTFGGHYDLAAYLVLLMPLVLGMYIYKKQIVYLGIFILSLCVLILTASRVSYGAYIMSITLFLLFMRKFKLLAFIILLTVVLTPLSDNLTNRISRTFKFQKIYIDPNTNQVIVPKDIRPDDLPPGDYIIGKLNTNKSKANSDKQANDTSIDAVKAKEQIKKNIISDAKRDGRILSLEQIDAQVEANFRSLIPQSKFIPDISQSTRLQVEWPRAISAFLRNPLLGKGPSSITEATDNDYLRWLGELGGLGTLLFLYILFSIAKYVYGIIKKLPADERVVYWGFLFGFFALMINATYIDVFEASKVAYMFWLLAGLFVASGHFYTDKNDSTKLFHLKTK